MEMNTLLVENNAQQCIRGGGIACKSRVQSPKKVFIGRICPKMRVYKELIKKCRELDRNWQKEMYRYFYPIVLAGEGWSDVGQGGVPAPLQK